MKSNPYKYDQKTQQNILSLSNLRFVIILYQSSFQLRRKIRKIQTAFRQDQLSWFSVKIDILPCSVPSGPLSDKHSQQIYNTLPIKECRCRNKHLRRCSQYFSFQTLLLPCLIMPIMSMNLTFLLSCSGQLRNETC